MDLTLTTVEIVYECVLMWHCRPQAASPLGRAEEQSLRPVTRSLPMIMVSDPAGFPGRLLLGSTPLLCTVTELHSTDVNTVPLVHRPQTDSTRHARIYHPRPLTHPPRVYVPMLMRPWILHTCHSTTSCHLGVSRTLSMLRRFY